MYIDKEGISLDVGDITGEGEAWFDIITEHEIKGLELLGCTVTRLHETVYVEHAVFRYPFYNRILGRDVLSALYGQYTNQVSVVLPSVFTASRFAEGIAQNLGWTHTMSSLVLVRELEESMRLPMIPLGYKVLQIESPISIEMGFEIFATFFLKPEESRENGFRRFTHNIEQGPHIIALYRGSPIAIAGSIAIGSTATFYSGLVVEQHRNTEILDRLMRGLSNILYTHGVRHIYMKTRNRAVELYSRRFYKVRHVYNERVYEKG